jgi:hypothetical protein
MSLHLGNDFSIPSRHIVCILDLSRSKEPDVSKELIAGSERVRKIGAPPYRSAILGVKGAIFLATVSTETIVGRILRNMALYKRMEGKYGQKPED